MGEKNVLGYILGVKWAWAMYILGDFFHKLVRSPCTGKTQRQRMPPSSMTNLPRLQDFLDRVARFFFVQRTKMGKHLPNDHKIYYMTTKYTYEMTTKYTK
jgi:hypothetical protein